MLINILYIATEYSFYTGCIIFTLGIIGNSLNIIIFTQLKLFRNNRSAFYIIIESISDFLYQLILISLGILTAIYGDDATGRSIIWCRFRSILAQFSVLVTTTMICFAAVDEFFSTNYSFHDLRQLCTIKLVRYFTFIFVCLWIIHSIVFSLFFNIQPLVGCVIINPIWLQYATYFYYPVLTGFLPITMASFFSLLAFRNVRRIIRRQIPIVRRRLNQQMTALILMRVILFVCLTLPYTLYRAYIINHPIPRTAPLAYGIGRLIQAIFVSFVSLNYAVNFYVFYIISSRFRRQVKHVLFKKCWERMKSRHLFRHNQVGLDTPKARDANIEDEKKN